jgi:hypothetical protein
MKNISLISKELGPLPALKIPLAAISPKVIYRNLRLGL